MSYSTVVAMTQSPSLLGRVAACVASEPGFTGDAQGWASQNFMRIVAKDPDWGTAWQYAADTATISDNPDLGARDDVINDGMILSVVQALLAPVAP